MVGWKSTAEEVSLNGNIIGFHIRTQKNSLKHISYLLIDSVVNKCIICMLVGAVWRSATTPQWRCTSGPDMITCVRLSVTSAEACSDGCLILRSTSEKYAATTRTKRNPSLNAASAKSPSLPRGT